MSSTMISSSNQKPFLIERRPLMLKDYLRDDLSSCSSNSFKSFPRQSQCCTTVRFLLEIDLKTKHVYHSNHTKQQQQYLKRSRSKATAFTTISALQKAVINVVKLLPFPSSSFKSPSSPSNQYRTRKGGLLPRSLSRKLFKKSFWRKPDHPHHHQREENEIGLWRLFREFLNEQDKPSEIQTSVNTSRISRSSSSNSWTSESEFTAHSGNLISERCNSAKDAATGKQIYYQTRKKSSSDRVGVTDSEDSITYSAEHTKEWSNEDEKEQFSPVSVLDCPFKDEEEVSSPFQRSLIRMEETKRKLMQKIRRFESLAQLEPVDLEKRIALEESDDEPLESPMRPCSMFIHNNNNNLFNEIREENGTEREAKELLKLVKAIMPSNNLISTADNLLLDFFMEKVEGNNASASMAKGQKEYEQELEEALDWINGHSQEMFLGWEMKENRHVYIKDVEKNGKWRNLDGEKEEVASELELEIFTSLVNEALLN